MSEWTVREATPRQREELLEIEDRLFSPGSSLRAPWLFDANPAGKALVLVATTPGNRIAGTRALLPWTLRVDGRPVRVGQYARTWTDPEFRHRGVSVAIGEALNRCSVERGYPLVFLFPSVRSIPGHRRIGNRVETLLERRQTLASLRFFKPWLPGATVALATLRRVRARHAVGQVTWQPETDAAGLAEALLPRLSSRAGVFGIRDAAFVGWRYGADSGRIYRAWRERSGRLAAITHLTDGRAKIVDLWGEADAGFLAAAAATLVEILAREGARLVEWCPSAFGPQAAAAGRAGLFRRRQGVPLARWFNRPEGELGALADLESYRLTEGDSDYA